MNLLKEIKWAGQRVVRGYDDRIFDSFIHYFNDFIPPLKEFCEKWLKDKDFVKYNSDPKKANAAIIYRETLKLIKSWEEASKTFKVEEVELYKLWAYVGDNLGSYWY